MAAAGAQVSWSMSALRMSVAVEPAPAPARRRPTCATRSSTSSPERPRPPSTRGRPCGRSRGRAIFAPAFARGCGPARGEFRGGAGPATGRALHAPARRDIKAWLETAVLGLGSRPLETWRRAERPPSPHAERSVQRYTKTHLWLKAKEDSRADVRTRGQEILAARAPRPGQPKD